jgi:hypothetical protein
MEEGFIVVFKWPISGQQLPEREIAGIEGDRASHAE